MSHEKKSEQLIALYDKFRMTEFLDESEGSDDPNVCLLRLFCSHFKRGWGWATVEQDPDVAQTVLDKVRELAKGGDAVAQASMGFAYWEGVLVERDAEESTAWYEKSALSGYPRAMNGMGQAYMEGRGVSRDVEKARGWYQKGADAGCPVCMYNLARTFEDSCVAFKWFAKSAELGFPPACRSVARRYRTGDGVGADDFKAYHWFRLAWENGEEVFDWMNDLGMIGDANHPDAFNDHPFAKMSVQELTEKAKSDVCALTYLAYLTQRGERGLKMDEEKAASMFLKAAEGGERDAQCLLGECYYRGWGVAKDVNKAVEWFAKSAGQGAAQAIGWMGNAYYRGEGVGRDYKRSIEYYEKAVRAGNENATANLAQIYLGLTETEDEDFDRGIDLAWILTCHGHMKGAYLLGLCYRYGFGAAFNPQRAAAMVALAAAGGCFVAIDDILQGAKMEPDWWGLATARQNETGRLDGSIFELLGNCGS